jgi:gliding motility-associated-like protein
MKNMLKKVLLLLFIISFQSINAQIKLKTNVGDELIDSGMSPCEYEENWSKIFTLSDFGIGPDEQFHITKGEVGIIRSDAIFNFNFGVFKIDENFPESDPILIGTSWMNLPAIDSPEIVQFELQNSIVVPAGVEQILIVIGRNYTGNPQELVIAGTEEDTSDSWFMGCREYYTYTLTSDLENPLPKANFYITATGEIFNNNNFGATTTLNHNVCDALINRVIYGCNSGGMGYSRDFILNEFGISANEEFVINSGQIGIGQVRAGVKIIFRIYEIDDNFPASFSDSNLIGTSQEVTLNYYNSVTNALPQIINVEFDNPVVVPKDVERILVEVYQTEDHMFPAATEVDDGSTSWIRAYNSGCTPFGEFKDVIETGWPKAKLYINVTGNTRNISNSFQMNISNICSEFLTEFSIENEANIASINWNFGDPDSGATNTSTDLSPFHDFSADGTFTITANVKGTDGSVEVLTETIEVKEPPQAYGIQNIEACENTAGSGIYNSFDTSAIENQVLKNQSNKVVTYIDGSGNQYDELPNPFTNTKRDREKITVKVARQDEPCCYAETTFDLIVNPLPDLSSIEDVYVCDNENDGFATFDLSHIQSDLSTNNLEIGFYFQDGGQIPNSQLDEVVNQIQDQEIITVRATNTTTNCYNEITFKIAITPPPIANTLPDLTGCDDNNDGISEYFDTSEIENTVLGNQTGMEVSYYNEAGAQLPGPLPNPYTNTIANQETLTVRVTNPQSGCYAETFLNFRTSSQPQINRPATIYACDNDNNGIASFDTSTIETEILGNQTGLKISYFDENGNALPSPLPVSFQNTDLWEQTIFIKVESELNSLCYSETSVDLIVNDLPEIDLESDYFLCDLEPSLYVAENPNFDTWLWTFEDGSVISNSFEANLVDAGTYTLQVAKTSNGVSCENSFSFNLVRSILPVIEEVTIRDISSNNSIEVTTSGDGNFEYSIDGSNYQQQNVFYNLSGGVYQVQVRDKNGCGSDEEEVVLVDYPKILTPNNDGYNDRWQISGVNNFPGSKILIYDRYGKLLKQLTSNSQGWDGSYNGKQMPADDYWFIVNLTDGRTFKGHFSLLR